MGICENCLKTLCRRQRDDTIGCSMFVSKVVSNADRIRAMSDEELAESLEDWQDWGGGLTKELWLEWLKQPADGSDVAE